MPEISLATVHKIMMEFAASTGLSPIGELPRRYLWTDAFAVCNFLELYRQTGEEAYRNLALGLVDQVHNILGRHREDDPRTGWISGLKEEEGAVHPTQGGLRIGKKFRERTSTDPFDEHLEWERDGQYFHYLTKWMHALNRVSRVTEEPRYQTWAVELAQTAHARFTYRPSFGGQKRMYWKMRIDLTSPLVSSMGQHDPLDGLMTYLELRASGPKPADRSPSRELEGEISEMAGICRGKSWVTDDPLGIGDLLANAWKAAQLMINREWEEIGLLERLLECAREGLESYGRTDPEGPPAEYRLAFRELGLSIGLKAAAKLQDATEQNPVLAQGGPALLPRIKDLRRFAPLAERTEKFWSDGANRRAASWRQHRDINMVMLATSLAPDGYLSL
jgi:hypothetical protein